MSLLLRKSYVPKQYLLSPVSLVPNGRVHLGHVAGPLLKIDVLARHLRRRGDFVVLASTSDAHESHVAVKAYQEGRSPEEVCRENFKRISDDLKALNIVYDEYVNPLDSRWREIYDRYNVQTMEDLISIGATEALIERIPYSPISRRYVVGGWLSGRCPACGAEAGSYFCEKCGSHFQPQEMLDAHPRFEEDAPLEWRKEKCLYLRLGNRSNLFDQWDRMSLRKDFQEVATRYLSENGPRIRLTSPGEWGLVWPLSNGKSRQVIFTYSALLWAPNVVCGDIYGRLRGDGINAFEPDSGVTTITCFGIDNAVPFLVGVLGTAIEQQRFKPFDHYLVNYFYNLEGSKFSTNRGHAIWAADIVELTPVASDIVRYYLSVVNPEFEERNLDVFDFVSFNNQMVQDLRSSVHESIRYRPVRTPRTPSPRLITRLEELLVEQDKALDPGSFALHGVSSAGQKWLHEKHSLIQDADDHTWWLKGTALLLYPVMPDLGMTLWTACGHEREPRLAAFLEPRPSRPLTSSLPLGCQVKVEDLKPCLPDTLTSDTRFVSENPNGE